MFGVRKRQKPLREVLEAENAEQREKRNAFYAKQLADGQRIMKYMQEGYLSGDYIGARHQFGCELAEVQSSIIIGLIVQNAELQERLEKLESKQ